MKRFSEPRVSRKNARGKKTLSPGFEHNNHWNICDVCGCAVRNKESRLTWDGKVVCLDDWDYRHPQDFVRGRKDDMSPVGLTRPETTTPAAARNPIAPYIPNPPQLLRATNTTLDYLEDSFYVGRSHTLQIAGSNLDEGGVLEIVGVGAVAYTRVDSETLTLTVPASVSVEKSYTFVFTNNNGEQGSLGGVRGIIPNYAATVLQDGPLVYSRFDESSGTALADSSGNNHFGTLIGSGTLGESALIYEGTALRLDGSSAYVQYSTGVADAVGSSSITMGAWVRVDSLAAVNTLLGFHDVTTTAPGGVENILYVGVGTDGALNTVFYDNVGASTNVVNGPSGTISTGTDYYIEVVLNRQTGTISATVNGEPLAGEYPYTDTAGIAPALTSQYTFSVGVDFDSPSGIPSQLLDGVVDEVVLYAHERTPLQAKILYDLGRGA